MLDTDIDPFGDDASAYSFIDDDAKSVGRYIEYTSGLSVIDFVRHSLLNSSVAFDINDVSDFVYFHIRRQWYRSMFAELAGEQVPGSSAVSLRIRHSGILITSRHGHSGR